MDDVHTRTRQADGSRQIQVMAPRLESGSSVRKCV